MLLLRRNIVSKLQSKGKSKAASFATVVSQDEEYTATPQYPEILDVSPLAKRERAKAQERDRIKYVKTVEEKQIKLNMPKYYGFKTYLLPEENVNYNSLSLLQHCTRTCLIESDKLPEYYDKFNVENIDIKGALEEAILMELNGYRRMHDIRKEELSNEDKDNIISSSMSKQVNRIILNHLSATHDSFKNIQVDHEPRIESTWVVGGMNPPENIKRYRRGMPWMKEEIDEATDRVVAYSGNPNLTLRSTMPLRPVVSSTDTDNTVFNVPSFKYDPRVVGIKTDHRHIINTPGFWPGDANEFGILSYNRRGHLFQRSYKDPQDYKELLHGQGILNSFGWLNSQANFLGFTTFNDITYPLVTQTVITNGKIWSFYVYQVNTILLHSKNIINNPKRNICWATPELKLYDSVTEGKVHGLNEGVINMIVKLYMNKPEERLGVNMKPYLDNNIKVSANYEDDEKREWLDREYKHLVSGRPRHKLSYEIYHWEKIYKIDHKTRSMEPRRRPFELFQKPYNRKLNERKPQYIPRVLRPHLSKNKGRDANEYFPE